MSQQASATKSWTLPIVPKSHNSLNWSHWRNKHRERNRWELAVKALPKGPWFVVEGKPLFTYPQSKKVLIRLVVYRWNVQDPTNIRASVKYLEDALVSRGWAIDDTAEWLDLVAEEKVDRKRQRTEIEWRAL